MCLIQGALGSSSGADEFTTVGPATTVARDEDFGRYRIIESLGEGGMGTVYLAEQLEPIFIKAPFQLYNRAYYPGHGGI